jgi:hypothetical protein
MRYCSSAVCFNAGYQPLVEESVSERRIGADTFEKFSHPVG